MEYQAERAYLDMVENGMDPGEALIEINKRNSVIAKVKEIKANLFADDAPVERHSSGSLTATSVNRAIEAEKKASKKRRRKLQKIRLEVLFLDEEPETRLIPKMMPETGYHVVIEKNREFSLKMSDPEASTMSIMDVAVKRCYEMTGHYPTCILVQFNRLLKLNEASYDFKHFVTKDKIAIPFDCAPDDADYDVMVVYDEPTDVDAWMQDRKSA
jgi:hypothetical protein